MFILILPHSTPKREKMQETTIKAIRVDPELWEKFKKIARLKDSDASKELRKFIKQYVEDNADLLPAVFIEIKSEAKKKKKKKGKKRKGKKKQ